MDDIINLHILKSGIQLGFVYSKILQKSLFNNQLQVNKQFIKQKETLTKMGGSNSTSQQLQEKQLLGKIDPENIPKCKDHQEESLMFVCTDEKCKNKMEIICRVCVSKQRDNIHRNHRVQSIKEIIQEVISNFKRLDALGVNNNNGNLNSSINMNSNISSNTPNRSFNNLSNNILTQGIPSDQDIEESFKKLAQDFMILSQNCKELSEQIMHFLILSKEDGKKIEIENTRAQTKKIIVDISNMCSNPNISGYQQSVKKLEQYLKFNGIKAKFIDSDGNLKKQVKKGTSDWLNSIWEEMKTMTQAVLNIKNIGPLPSYVEMLEQMQKKVKEQQTQYQLNEYLKQQQYLQEQQLLKQQELEEQMRQETQKRQEIEEFLRQQKEEEENEIKRIQEEKIRDFQSRKQSLVRQRDNLVNQMEYHVQNCHNNHCKYVEWVTILEYLILVYLRNDILTYDILSQKGNRGLFILKRIQQLIITNFIYKMAKILKSDTSKKLRF
ncbi:hypothetical protein TTHERM_00886970 (macronuclear) [Tetrahymena thermophila SB210]|uniref:B box-type domain-containing protein n=1 Tax=Tetrahymena thermophila (strain SB210) TaxID=312017 RepID=Q239Y1_TETTS|nr:hypothetical protein TTHERM_00886970 [Tetrahymena thermophila SB210]EAR93382.2 hypothetical protein TTHERM_00886970 [Tetrahymena thermophila SB210]|eukprot:XP_001013627.2 hypothetical protein TTHERM_00886970 [Tetrahymena thermophila SB210]